MKENKYQYNEITNSSWKEKVFIETSEHIICGDVFMPKVGKKERVISDILNSGKNFLAVKDCTLEYKHNRRRELEHYKFLQINMSSIMLMRPLENE